jgi:hypothetical protein
MMLFIGAMVVFSLLYSTPSEIASDRQGGFFSREWEMPSFNLNLEFISDLNLQPWILGTVVALFLLVISDAGFRRRRLS